MEVQLVLLLLVYTKFPTSWFLPIFYVNDIIKINKIVYGRSKLPSWLHVLTETSNTFLLSTSRHSSCTWSSCYFFLSGFVRHNGQSSTLIVDLLDYLQWWCSMTQPCLTASDSVTGELHWLVSPVSGHFMIDKLRFWISFITLRELKWIRVRTKLISVNVHKDNKRPI